MKHILSGICILCLMASAGGTDERKKNERRTIKIEGVRNGVLVLGECKVPSIVVPAAQERLSVGDVISRCDGITDAADPGRIRVIRGGTETMLNLAAINARDAMQPVLAGDIVIVLKQDKKEKQ